MIVDKLKITDTIKFTLVKGDSKNNKDKDKLKSTTEQKNK